MIVASFIDTSQEARVAVWEMRTEEMRTCSGSIISNPLEAYDYIQVPLGVRRVRSYPVQHCYSCISPNKRLVATMFTNQNHSGFAIVWARSSHHSGRHFHQLYKPEAAYVNDFCFTSESQNVCVATLQGLSIHNLAGQGSCDLSQSGTIHSIVSVSFREKQYLLGTKGCRIQLFEYANGQLQTRGGPVLASKSFLEKVLIAEELLNSGQILALAYSRSGVVLCAIDPCQNERDSNTNEDPILPIGNPHWNDHFVLSGNASLAIASRQGEKVLRLFNCSNGERVQVLGDLTIPIADEEDFFMRCAVSHNGQTIAGLFPSLLTNASSSCGNFPSRHLLLIQHLENV